MRVILDTHVVLWWYSDPKKIHRESRLIIEDASNEIYLSAAVIWEIKVKLALKKLSFPEALLIKAIEDMTELPIKTSHAMILNNLEKIHNDPFDWLLIAQAKAEDVFLMTRDQLILKYNLKLLKA